MTPDARLGRFLGVAFLAQFVTSLAAGALSLPILTGDISPVMVGINNNVDQMRAAIVLDLATCVGIIVMTALLYVVLRGQSRIVALVALVLWLAEAMLTAVSVLALYALLPLSAEFVKAGAPPTSYYETLGVAFLGIEQHAYDLTLLFFCLGAFLWYGLFFRSRIVPRALAAWGLLAMPLVLAGTLVAVWDRGLNVSFAIYLPYLPFELVTGLWLLVRGTRSTSTAGAEDCGVGD